MVTKTMDTPTPPRSLPEAALALNVSLDALRHLLKRRPQIDAQLPRAGGRRVVGPVELDMLRNALAERRGVGAKLAAK